MDRSPNTSGEGLIEALAVPSQEFVAPAEERIAVASQWQLMWWRFRKHRLAMAGTLVVIIFYLAVIGADFLAYADPEATQAVRSLSPPQPINLFDDGSFRPFVYGITGKRDPTTLQRVYQVDTTKKTPIQFFAQGFPYKLLGLIPLNIHLIGVEGAKAGDAIAILGTDELGRDVWSRLVFATRISMTIGLVSVTLSLVIGILLGGIAIQWKLCNSCLLGHSIRSKIELK